MTKNYCYPIQEILSTYDYGFRKDTLLIRLIDGQSEPITAQDFNGWTEGAEFEYVAVQDVAPGDSILGTDASADGASTCFYQATGLTFAWEYKIFTVSKLNCLYTNKTITFNSNYSFLPDQDVYIWNGTDFFWKKAYDVTLVESLIGEDGTAVPITSSVYDDCTEYLFWHVSIEEDQNRIALFNGDTPNLIIAGTPKGVK